MRRISQLLGDFFTGPQKFETPDFTRVQQVALGQAIVAVLVAFGFDLSEDDRQLIIGLAAIVASVLSLSDVFIRRARANNSTGIAQAREMTAGAGGKTPSEITQRRRDLLVLLSALRPQPQSKGQPPDVD